MFEVCFVNIIDFDFIFVIIIWSVYYLEAENDWRLRTNFLPFFPPSKLLHDINMLFKIMHIQRNMPSEQNDINYRSKYVFNVSTLYIKLRIHDSWNFGFFIIAFSPIHKFGFSTSVARETEIILLWFSFSHSHSMLFSDFFPAWVFQTGELQRKWKSRKWEKICGSMRSKSESGLKARQIIVKLKDSRKKWMKSSMWTREEQEENWNNASEID